MMLEANPNLGYRDIQEILAYSSYQSDPNHSGGAYSWEFNQGSHWNNGGLHFSNDYGFGMIDATAAVRLAESWSKLQTFHNLFFVSNASNANLFIPDANPSGVSDTITLGGNIEIDKIEVDINIDHTWWGDLQIKLISPDNTESILLDRIGINPDNGNGINSGFGMIGTSFFNVTETNLTFTLTSNAFWGEQSAGDWTLQVIDLQGADTGTLIDWQLNVFGDLIDTNDLYVFTDEYATLAADPSRQILNDTDGGNDTINLAAVRSDNVVHLSSNSISTVANANLQMNSSIENVIMGVGNDYVYASSKDNLIDGGEGNDIIYGYTGDDVIAGSAGVDHLYAGSGADTLSGGTGDDLVQGNGGDDIILGDEGGDLLFGGKGNDLILGGENGDIILGNNDNDELYGENGDDNLFGGKGNDTLIGGNGADNLQGNSGDDLLIGGDQNDTLIGTSGNDTLNGQAGDDNLNGGSGLDLFIISTGNDILFGFKKGDDTLDYSQLGVTSASLDTNNDNLINA
ncbi:MAG: proprotein convertase P-domain-containing protein, partial [Rickettsiales bacterium]|nr:proprotein convertase P-domain-containing protein [Rickettsiales bacterium]